MAREVSNEAILNEIYGWTSAYNGEQQSLEEMREAIISLCLCSEDVERRVEHMNEEEKAIAEADGLTDE